MEYEKIKELMQDMGNSKLSEIEIEFSDGIKIKMKKDAQEIYVQKKIIQEPIEQKTEEQPVIENGNIVKSPMVGTFYLRPSPNAKPYVEKGSKVEKGTVLCIVEAMKLMNEIESEWAGTIEEIYVKDGEPVEYGKPLFKII